MGGNGQLPGKGGLGVIRGTKGSDYYQRIKKTEPLLLGEEDLAEVVVPRLIT